MVKLTIIVLISISSSFQVFLHNHIGVHADYSRSPVWDMFCVAAEWLYLHMGCRSCRAQIFEVRWVHRRWVVLHVLDHIRCQQLPSMSANNWLKKLLSSYFSRLRQIILYLKWLFGRCPSLVASETTMQNGEHLFGLYQKVFSFCPLSWIVYRQRCTPAYLSLGSASWY